MTEQQALDMLDDQKHKWARINTWTICIWIPGKKLSAESALLDLLARGGFRYLTTSYDSVTDTTKHIFRTRVKEADDGL